MIDMHCHILPGVDDGAKNMDETLQMISQLHESGFNTLVATPHVLEGRNFLSPAEILTTTEQVRKRVAEAGISVEILPGAENYIFPDMAKWAQAGKMLTLGNTGKYLLVEFPMLEIPHYTDQVFFELQVLGITPVLAHPERYKGIAEEPKHLVDWAKKGILFQLDLRSLSGRYGPQPKRLAELMFNSGLIHLIGSDAHRISESESSYLKTLQSVKQIVGEEGFQEMTLKNPQAILAGNPLSNTREYTLNKPVRKNKFWSFFR